MRQQSDALLSVIACPLLLGDWPSCVMASRMISEQCGLPLLVRNPKPLFLRCNATWIIVSSLSLVAMLPAALASAVLLSLRHRMLPKSSFQARYQLSLEGTPNIFVEGKQQ